MSSPPQSFVSHLIKKEEFARDVCSFYFERPSVFEFIPGQYIKMILDIKNPDERGNSRFFSIASSPTEQDHLMITTRIIESAFKKTLAGLPIGSAVQMRGPHGTFVLDMQDLRPKVFLTGGIGITPFRSMSIYSYVNKLQVPIVLIASFKSVSDLIFFDELNKIQNQTFKFIPTITSESDSWQGAKGRIDENMLKRYIAKPLESIYYIAGPAGMVDAMVVLVKRIGVLDEQIKSENFPGY